MKNNFISLICITLVCAAVMFGVMGIYRLVGSKSSKLSKNSDRVHIHSVSENFEFTDSRIAPIN